MSIMKVHMGLSVCEQSSPTIVSRMQYHYDRVFDYNIAPIKNNCDLEGISIHSHDMCHGRIGLHEDPIGAVYWTPSPYIIMIRTIVQ